VLSLKPFLRYNPFSLILFYFCPLCPPLEHEQMNQEATSFGDREKAHLARAKESKEKTEPLSLSF
jgi:hypothetical protein